MMDYSNLGSAPTDEDCAQVGSDGYWERASIECKVFRKQLRRIFGEEKFPNRLKIKSFPHDFGDYLEVVIYYDDENEESLDWALKLEDNLPERWDEEAKKELVSWKLQSDREYYCTVPSKKGNCSECSLSSYGKDCRNNPIKGGE